MAFLRSGLAYDAPPAAQGQGLHLRPLASGDYAQWAELRARSRAHLVPWEPAWPADDLSRLGFRRRLRHYQREARDDLGYAFAVIKDGSGRLLGGLSLSNVRRGVSQIASLGYWIGAPYAGQGLMTEAVRCFLPYAFGPLRLHRIEAVSQPANLASIRVLEKNGFVREGYARKLLKIHGVWADHVLYAMLADDVPANGGPPA